MREPDRRDRSPLERARRRDLGALPHRELLPDFEPFSSPPPSGRARRASSSVRDTAHFIRPQERCSIHCVPRVRRRSLPSRPSGTTFALQEALGADDPRCRGGGADGGSVLAGRRRGWATGSEVGGRVADRGDLPRGWRRAARAATDSHSLMGTSRRLASSHEIPPPRRPDCSAASRRTRSQPVRGVGGQRRSSFGRPSGATFGVVPESRSGTGDGEACVAAGASGTGMHRR